MSKPLAVDETSFIILLTAPHAWQGFPDDEESAVVGPGIPAVSIGQPLLLEAAVKMAALARATMEVT